MLSKHRRLFGNVVNNYNFSFDASVSVVRIEHFFPESHLVGVNIRWPTPFHIPQEEIRSLTNHIIMLFFSILRLASFMVFPKIPANSCTCNRCSCHQCRALRLTVVPCVNVLGLFTPRHQLITRRCTVCCFTIAIPMLRLEIVRFQTPKPILSSNFGWDQSLSPFNDNLHGYAHNQAQLGLSPFHPEYGCVPPTFMH